MKTKTLATTSAPAPRPTVITGTEGDDFLLITSETPTRVMGYGGNDTISFYGDADHTAYGGAGADVININGSGDVTAYGGTGDDRFNVNSKQDNHIDGGDGHDIADFRGLVGNSVNDNGFRFDLAAGTVTHLNPTPWFGFETTWTNIEEIYGSYWDDLFIGSQEADIVHGVGGFDTFYGNGGDDVFYASTGGSVAYGWQDNDHLVGDRGGDEFHGGNGEDTLDGGDGRDELHGDAGDDLIYGGDGEDTITAGTGSDRVYAGNDWDVVYATASQYDHDIHPDYYDGGEGRDVLSYENSDIAVYLNSNAGVAGAWVDGQQMGVDTFNYFETFVGSGFDDFLRSSNGGFGGYREFIYGGDGDDTIYASKGDDLYYGDEGFDTVDFSGMYSAVLIDFDDAGPYSHDAKIGDDLYHLNDVESFIGSRVDDTFIGDATDTWFEGGLGDDTATGAGGEDVFVFRDRGVDLGYDHVTDFTRGEDKVLLDGLHAWDGTLIEDWTDLDSNGNGVLDHGDDAIWFTFDSALLLFDEGTVELEGINALAGSDFMFG